MVRSQQLALTLVSILTLTGASYRTTNFTVEAPTDEVARQVGDTAERCRKAQAKLWLGEELADWDEPCPIEVKVTFGASGGATSFAYDRGRVLGQTMRVEGTVERLLCSVLPHEVNHTVFAHHFCTQVPRWADEGGAVFSEDSVERRRHERLMRALIDSPERLLPLRRLFKQTEYPQDVMTFYVESYSISQFLVAAKGRAAYLAFVKNGMKGNWDSAVKRSYGYKNVDELETGWLKEVRKTPAPPKPDLLPKPAEVVRGPGRILGSVQDLAGRRQPRVEVVLQDDDGVVARTFTDDDGDFRFAEVPAGRYKVRSHKSSGAGKPRST